MCSPDKLGIQLLFIPEEYGGFGGGAFDVYCVCEEMARIDLGVATSVLATFLGSDPITVGATPEQKKLWLSRIADEGILFAYGATEPDAGSDLGALQTTADRVMEGDQIVGYKHQRQQAVDQQRRHRRRLHRSGQHARRPKLVHRGAAARAGFSPRQAGKQARHPPQQHGGALVQRRSMSIADRLIGGVEGQGLIQAQAVFGYTRLMVAAFGLGAGWSALDRAIPYSTKRIQAGAPLSEKQGYTHKLIVPHVVRLEAGTRLHRGDRRAHRCRRRRQLEHRRRHRQVHGHGGRKRRGRGQHPGAGRLRLHPRVHGGEDQPRRAHHLHLRRHLRNHGDDHQPRSLAVAPQDTRPVLSRPRRAKWRILHAQHPNVGAGLAAAGHARPGRSHGAARASAASDPLPAHSAATGRMDCLRRVRRQPWLAARRAWPRASCTKRPTAASMPQRLAAIARIFAREAALRVAQEGLRWVIGAGGNDATWPLDRFRMQFTARRQVWLRTWILWPTSLYGRVAAGASRAA